MSSLLLVEDDTSLGLTLTERLTQEGYTVRWVTSKKEAEQICQNSDKAGFPFDLLILDIGLPDGSGLDFARDLLAQKIEAPILFLSAMSSAEYRLEGYELGALDYIPKPFHLRELLLRITRALATRGVHRKLRCGTCDLDVESFSLIIPDGRRITLTKRDTELLQLLRQKAPRVISRDEILLAWKDDPNQSERSVDNAIVRLRQVLKEHNSDFIRSVRGIGYQWLE